MRLSRAHVTCRASDTDIAPVGSAVRDTAGVEVAVLVERQQRHPEPPTASLVIAPFTATRLSATTAEAPAPGRSAQTAAITPAEVNTIASWPCCGSLALG